MPKISIFVFLLELFRGTGMFGYGSYIAGSTLSSGGLAEVGTNLLLVCAFLSLVIGTVVGLGQYRLKRLFAYSTISHVGFLLLALAISSEESVNAFLFYIVQYSLTNVDAFFVILAFGYMINNNANPAFKGHAQLAGDTYDIQFISQLRGQFRANPVLGLSLAICLFSMAGVPPLVGFFGKYTVLYTAIHNGYMFLAIVAILASVVSAVYYLRVIRVIHFDAGPVDTNTNTSTVMLTSVHSYVISTLTLFVMLFAANPNLLLNSTSIMALSLYAT
jgi:NADH-ubiquinone oxidoreductase chain 2